MKNWQEIYTAYQVAQQGTISKVAEVLDIHRATVVRHIDRLEKNLGCKLFHRHSRGYTLTEAGEHFLNVATTADEQFAQLKVHLLNDDLSGEFIITSLDFIAPYVLPAVAQFREQNPKVKVRYLTGADLFKLEHAQAHLAIRTGAKPQDDDYVVRPFIQSATGLYASPQYVQKKGTLAQASGIHHHDFICSDDRSSKPPIMQWIQNNIPTENIIFTSNKISVMTEAVVAGLGIGAVRVEEAKKLGLVEMRKSEPNWTVQNWVVTHVDLHRSEKVQRFLRVLSSIHNT